MDRKQTIRTLLQDIAQDAAPAETIELGPGIREKALSMQNETRRIHRRWRLALGAIAGVGLVVGLLMAVPTTRAAIDDLLKRLGIHLAPEEETNNTTVAMSEATVLTVTPVFLSVEDVQAGTPFKLRTPGWLPDGIAYKTGWTYWAGRERSDQHLVVRLTYTRDGAAPARDAPALVLEISRGDLPAWYLSAKAAQDVQVSGQPGIYIHGDWTTSKPLQPGETRQGLFWDNADDDGYLSWVQDNLAYRIWQHGLGLGLEKMTRIAESLK